ncbi:hypothetical protein V6N11_003543 [Hibiscus sabdariffa]|uniref:Uncharacterized protein n=1 Tax=Hibiscus sabdariffa TaxID=183260 RepID=A0ABR2SDP0_9ROSI
MIQVGHLWTSAILVWAKQKLESPKLCFRLSPLCFWFRERSGLFLVEVSNSVALICEPNWRLHDPGFEYHLKKPES